VSGPDASKSLAREKERPNLVTLPAALSIEMTSLNIKKNDKITQVKLFPCLKIQSFSVPNHK
jgi:hypothetical protein